jgi:hypothetical protein
MADNETAVKPGFPEVQKNNDEVARKLADQDAAGHSTALTDADLRDTGGALDKLAAAHDKKVQDSKEDEPAPVEPAPKEKPDDKIVEPPVVKDPPTTPPAPSPEEVAKAEAAKKAEDFFKDAPKLPPNASPKSAEAFSAVKIKAAQEISAREQALETLKKEKADLEAKVKAAGDVSPEALKELEDLRQWRAKLDVEASPKFQEFDKKVAANQEFIYAQLKKSPAITDATIEAIKKHGGPEMVNMEKIFEAVKDPAMQRLIENRLADIEQQKFEKEKAVSDTKANIGEYLKQQKESYAKSATAHNDATKTHFDEYAAKLPWFKEKPVDEKADEATKKATAEHNAFIKTVKNHMDVALSNDSADMRAILLTGMAQLLYLQRAHAGVTAELESEKKKLTEANEKLDKIAKSGTRLRESAAPPTPGTNVTKKDSDIFHKKAGDALDDIAKQVMDERSRAAGTK